MHTTYVIAGGPHPAPTGAEAAPWRSGLPHPDSVIAVDSGLHLAQDLGLPVEIVVGDLDSVDPARLERAASQGCLVQRHPTDKDATDLELALEIAVSEATASEATASEAVHVVVVASRDGRLDHLLGLVSVIASPRFAGVELTAVAGPARLLPVHRHRRIPGAIGELVSLLPFGGPAVGVRTQGLRWPLEDETLQAGTGRGVSNEIVASDAAVDLRRGALLAVLPGEASLRTDRTEETVPAETVPAETVPVRRDGC